MQKFEDAHDQEDAQYFVGLAGRSDSHLILEAGAGTGLLAMSFGMSCVGGADSPLLPPISSATENAALFRASLGECCPSKCQLNKLE